MMQALDIDIELAEEHRTLLEVIYHAILKMMSTLITLASSSLGTWGCFAVHRF